MSPVDREPTLGELADDLRELKDAIRDTAVDLSRQIKELPFVRIDVYEAKHEALRQSLTQQVDGVRAVAESASKISWWALGLVAVLVVGAIVTFVATGGSGG